MFWHLWSCKDKIYNWMIDLSTWLLYCGIWLCSTNILFENWKSYCMYGRIQITLSQSPFIILHTQLSQLLRRNWYTWMLAQMQRIKIWGIRIDGSFYTDVSLVILTFSAENIFSFNSLAWNWEMVQSVTFVENLFPWFQQPRRRVDYSFSKLHFSSVTITLVFRWKVSASSRKRIF